MKTTKKEIQRAFDHLAQISGYATTKSEAIERKQDKFMAIDYAPIYGGYRLVAIGVSNGGHYGIFDMSSSGARMKPTEFYNTLRGIAAGIEYSNKKSA